MNVYYVWQRDLRLMHRMLNSFTLTILGTLISLAVFAPTLDRLLAGIPVGAARISYLQFYVPGALIVAAFAASFYSGGSIQHDRREGMLQVMAASALPRTDWALGKILSAVTRALIIVLGLFAVITAAGFRFIHPVTGTLGLFLMVVAVSWSFGALSTSLALAIRHRFGYDILITSITAPLTYLAAITYPEGALPGYLQLLAHLNPLTYAANGAREAIVYGTAPSMPNLLVPFFFAMLFSLGAIWVAHNLRGERLLPP